MKINMLALDILNDNKQYIGLKIKNKGNKIIGKVTSIEKSKQKGYIQLNATIIDNNTRDLIIDETLNKYFSIHIGTDICIYSE